MPFIRLFVPFFLPIPLMIDEGWNKSIARCLYGTPHDSLVAQRNCGDLFIAVTGDARAARVSAWS